jgi:hypothetical protein
LDRNPLRRKGSLHVGDCQGRSAELGRGMGGVAARSTSSAQVRHG